MIHEHIFMLLSTAPALTPLIGDRVYPLLMPQQTVSSYSNKPCIVYRESGIQTDETFCGTEAEVITRYDFDCYGITYDSAKATATALQATLLDYEGTLCYTVVTRVKQTGMLDLLDPEPGLFRTTLSYDIRNRPE